MNNESAEALNKTGRWIVIFVLLFWVGYLAIAFVLGFASSIVISSEVWRLTAWGFVSSAGLVALSRFLMRIEKGPRTDLNLALSPSSFKRFAIGFLLIIAAFAGPIRFEWVPGVGAMAAAIYFAQFLSTFRADLRYS